MLPIAVVFSALSNPKLNLLKLIKISFLILSDSLDKSFICESNKSFFSNNFSVTSSSLISSSSIEKEKKYPVKVQVDIGKVTISCTNQTGDAKEELYVSTEGKNLEAGFNPKYFLDSLKAVDYEEVFVEFGTNISPCLVKSVENSEYVYMILPIRLKE